MYNQLVKVHKCFFISKSFTTYNAFSTVFLFFKELKIFIYQVLNVVFFYWKTKTN